jgi:aminopeptidase YwaD
MIFKLKIIVFVITTILMLSPIISSTSIKKEKNEIFTENLIIKADLEQKIIDAINMVNETLLIGLLEELVSFGPRFTGTWGCEQAARYIKNQFENWGIDSRYQYWESFSDRLPLRYYKDKNVIGRLEGIDSSADDIIVFNAHYDTVKVSPGANDDGSGVVAVLAAAYILRNFEFNRTVEFVLFSGEEIGLLGSRAYVEELYENDTELLVEFNADMIGYAETKTGGRNVSISSTSDALWMVDKIRYVNQNSGINFNIRSSWSIEPYRARGGSDFYDFCQYGYEVIAFWQSEWNRDYFHTPEDTIENMNISYYVNMTKLIIGSLAYMADVENTNPQIKIGAPRRGMLYFEDQKIRKLKHDKIRVIDDILICTEVKAGDAPIEKVEFYYDDKLIFTDTEAPYQYRLNKFSIRRHMIKVIVYDEKGRNASDTIRIHYINLLKNR